MKIVNKTNVNGPYPDKTWEAIYGKESTFCMEVIRKIEETKCDFCLGECSSEFTCCSKRCWDSLCKERESEFKPLLNIRHIIQPSNMKPSLKRMIADEISGMTDIDETAARISKLITLKVTIPKKVWILLGEVEDADGSEVVAVFKRNPTERQKKEALKRHIFCCYGVKNEKDLKEKAEIELTEEMDRYSLNVYFRDIEP